MNAYQEARFHVQLSKLHTLEWDATLGPYICCCQVFGLCTCTIRAQFVCSGLARASRLDPGRSVLYFA